MYLTGDGRQEAACRVDEDQLTDPSGQTEQVSGCSVARLDAENKAHDVDGHENGQENGEDAIEQSRVHALHHVNGAHQLSMVAQQIDLMEQPHPAHIGLVQTFCGHLNHFRIVCFQIERVCTAHEQRVQSEVQTIDGQVGYQTEQIDHLNSQHHELRVRGYVDSQQDKEPKNVDSCCNF